jgi:hypothetical protein
VVGWVGGRLSGRVEWSGVESVVVGWSVGLVVGRGGRSSRSVVREIISPIQ